MQDFSFRNQGKILFGEGQREEFARCVAAHAKNVLLLCGRHFEKSGELDALTEFLRSRGIRVLPHVMKNSTMTELTYATVIGCEAGIDGVIGAGGAMVMDLCKLVAYAAVHRDLDLWSMFRERRDAVGEKLFTATVPTYPSSGSELDGACEIINDQTGQPGGFYGESLIPDVTWLNPRYTMSVPKEDLAYGMLASFVQTSIACINPRQNFLAEQFAAGILDDILASLFDAVVNNPKELGPRGELMLCSCLSGYGLPYMGKGEVDFSLYTLEGYLEEAAGLPYARALVTLYPYWLKYGLQSSAGRDNVPLTTYCHQFFNSREECVEKILKSWEILGIPTTLKKMGPAVSFDWEKFKELAYAGGTLDSIFGELTPEILMRIMDDAAG